MIRYLRNKIAYKLILTVGLTLLIVISIWAYFNIKYQQEKLMHEIMEETDRLTNTIRLGTHSAMMLNKRDDINQIINNIAKLEEISNIRIYNKDAQIKFSNQPREVDLKTNIKAEACDICHQNTPPLADVDLKKRTRIFRSSEGYRLLGIISPIANERGCATADCHVHPVDKKILGALDVVVSLQKTDQEIIQAEIGIIALAAFQFLITSTIIFGFVMRFVNRPIKQLIDSTRSIAKGDFLSPVAIKQIDELSELASEIQQMGSKIGQKQAELKRQRDEYQNMFDRVPCLITIQDRGYRLLNFNHEFVERFAPQLGDFCFKAYKGRDQKCVNCLVEKTFEDGRSHSGEETGLNKDGTVIHWILRTSPIKNAEGEIVAAMEMSLDITEKRQLEKELQISERKYQEIFDHIPNPVFVLDYNRLVILDCNESVTTDYGYEPRELKGRSFLDLFADEEKAYCRSRLQTFTVLNQVKHQRKDGKTLFVNIRISPSDYPGNKIILATTSDITKRLEAEQQLIQASKMATLGQMATGIAHELNQPLSVIKTTSSFFMRKYTRREPIENKLLFTMIEKVDRNVDRATNIINHMRQFARKSELKLEKVQLNDVLKSAFEIFSQQLRVRGIEVIWDIDPNLPKIMADPGRLEQVFINLLLNARDSIEEKYRVRDSETEVKKISLQTSVVKRRVSATINDTGSGFPKTLAEKLFEPFFTTKEIGKGTGLGLSISYGIVKDCGGEIRAVSHAEQGATFSVTFPIAD